MNTQTAEEEPNFTLDKQIARARREMGPERWQQLCREWNEGTRDGD